MLPMDDDVPGGDRKRRLRYMPHVESAPPPSAGKGKAALDQVPSSGKGKAALNQVPSAGKGKAAMNKVGGEGTVDVERRNGAQPQSLVGLASYSGSLLSREHINGVKWYKLAADQGLPSAQVRILSQS